MSSDHHYRHNLGVHVYIDVRCHQDPHGEGEKLIKLYRRRPKKGMSQSEDSFVHAEQLVDEEVDRPEMVDDATWQRLIDAMNAKFSLDHEMKATQNNPK